MRLVLALIVFGLDLWALTSLRSRGLTRRRSLAWTAAIVSIPIIGAALWLRHTRASTATAIPE